MTKEFEPRPRKRGESPKAYARFIRNEEETFRFEQEEAERRRIADKIESCSHYSCEPCRWHWDGRVSEMYCPDCGSTNYLDEEA